ncbi:MAG: ThuA domain-containing protein [Fimbriimonadales bacterium]
MIVSIVAAFALAPQPAATSILVFTKTAGFRHDSIPAARHALREIGRERKWFVTTTEDATWFDGNHLKNFDAIVFLLTTGDVLNTDQEAAMKAFVNSGGGFVGVHAASDTEYEWEWYGFLVGGYFASHPPTQEAVVRIEDRRHASTSFLPKEWKRIDEWYDFKANPRPRVRVLATVDESTYDGGKMGVDHPIMWCHEFDGGRSWYTAMGHTNESYGDPLFRRMLGEGIVWACRTR